MSEWVWKQKPVWKQFCARLTLQHDPGKGFVPGSGSSRVHALQNVRSVAAPAVRHGRECVPLAAFLSLSSHFTRCYFSPLSFSVLLQLDKPFSQILLFTIVIFCFFENLQTKVLSACFPLWIHDGCGHVESSAFWAMMRLSLAGTIVWLHAFRCAVVGTETFANFCFAQIHAVAEADSLADSSDGPSPGG